MAQVHGVCVELIQSSDTVFNCFVAENQLFAITLPIVLVARFQI